MFWTKLNKLVDSWIVEKDMNSSPGVSVSGRGSAAALTPPPLVLRGYQSQDEHKNESSVGVDWLNVSFPFEKCFEIAKYLKKLTGSEPEVLDYGRWRYNGCVSWSEWGLCLYLDQTEERSRSLHGGRCTVAVPGKLLNCLDGDGVRQLLRDFVYQFWGIASRVDLAFDDYERRVDPWEVYQVAEIGDYTKFQTHDPHFPKKRIKGEMQLTGSMCTFGHRGSKGSGKYLRVYDKNLESNGEKNCVRWELELSGDKAKSVFLKFAESSNVDELGAYIGALIAGSIRFLQRDTGDKNLSRCKNYDWWDSIIELLGGVTLKMPSRVRTVETNRDWIKRDVASSIALQRRCMSSEDFEQFIRDLVEVGEKRFNSNHHKLIELHERRGLDSCLSYFKEVA